MRFNCIYIAITILFLTCEGISQQCPEIKDVKTAAQFLVDHKSKSTAADRHCVDAAFEGLTFATGYRNKNYIEFLVGMLDFERWTPEEYVEAGEPKYPAINELHHLNGMGKSVVPYLIKGIRESDSEVLRKNAAETLYYSISACGALTVLKRQAEMAEVPYEQKIRLEAAAKHINELTPLNPPCEPISSKP